MSVDTDLIRRRLEWGTVAPDRLGYVPVNAEALRDDVTALCDEVDQLRRALAGHLFDGESLSTREAIRSELIIAGFEAMNELDRLHGVVARVRALCEEPCTFCLSGVSPHNRYEVATSAVLAVLDGEAAHDGD
jgi:hypothetical protein